MIKKLSLAVAVALCSGHVIAAPSAPSLSWEDQKYSFVDVNIDGQYAGVLKENGGLYGGRRNRLLARINRDDELKLHPIVVGDKEVASVQNPMKTDKHNPRAFQCLRPMESKEEKMFMALAILEMVQESLKEEF